LILAKTRQISFGLYGAGGFAREVMPFARRTLQRDLGDDGLGVFFVETIPSAPSVNGFEVISEQDFLSSTLGDKLFNVAISDSRVRARLVKTCIEHGARAISLAASTASVCGSSLVGEGAILCDNTIITANARIGAFFHMNLYSYVAHDCVIGDYVTFAPRVSCNGAVHIGDHAYIGTGAILKQGHRDRPLRIGEGAVVGMGAVVTKDVPPFTTVVGCPARPIKRKFDEGG
jgi:sugar O-acyltransferase (sialic acid O-acetyltransferase NeuD family)